MNRSILLGLAALAGIVVGAGIVLAAAGDVTRTSPPSYPTLQMEEFCVRQGLVSIFYRDDGGKTRQVEMRNGTSTGWNDDTDTPVRVSTPTGFTDALNALTITNAKRTALTAAARNAGALVMTGTNQ